MSAPHQLSAVWADADRLRTQGNLAAARDLLEPVADIAAIRLGTDDPDVIETMRRLATVHRELGELASARRVLEEALEGALPRLGEQDSTVLSISAELGAIADELGNRHEARRNLGRVARYGPSVLGSDHPFVRAAERYMAGGGVDATPWSDPVPRGPAQAGDVPAPHRLDPPAQRPEPARGAPTQRQGPTRGTSNECGPAPARRKPDGSPWADVAGGVGAAAGSPPRPPFEDPQVYPQDTRPHRPRHSSPADDEPPPGDQRTSGGQHGAGDQRQAGDGGQRQAGDGGQRRPLPESGGTPPPRSGGTPPRVPARREPPEARGADGPPPAHPGVWPRRPSEARGAPHTGAAGPVAEGPDGWPTSDIEPADTASADPAQRTAPHGNAPYRDTPHTGAASPVAAGPDGWPTSDIEPADTASADPAQRAIPHGNAPYGDTPHADTPHGDTPHDDAPHGHTPYGDMQYDDPEPFDGAGLGGAETEWPRGVVPSDLAWPAEEDAGRGWPSRGGADPAWPATSGPPIASTSGSRLPATTSPPPVWPVDVDGYDREGGYDRGERRGSRLRAPLLVGLVMIVAVLGSIVVVAALRGHRGNSAAPPAVAGSSTASPTEASSSVSAPPVVRLRDNGGTVTLNWSDPTSGRAPFVVAGGRAGGPAQPFPPLPPGQTSYTLNGLNPKLDYCFTVGVVYSTDVVTLSSLVCTQRNATAHPTAS